VLRYLPHALIGYLILFQAVLLVISLANAATLRRARRHPTPAHLPRVSVLVPARNEEANIGRCVASLLAQDYPELEVLVLDDGSTDATRAILEALAASDARLRVLEGQPLAAGWLGKAWACAQLAAQATGELLYFTDADTAHAPAALRTAVAALEGEGAGLLSGFPRQEVATWGEKLIVPFFYWRVLCFVPLRRAYQGERTERPGSAYAVGQMLLFRRSTYEALGGHAAVRATITEDLAFAQRALATGQRWRMINAVDIVSCRMYRSGREARAGLSKNLFAAFDFRLVPYLGAWLWVAWMFLGPLASLALYAVGAAPGTALPGLLLGLLLGCVAGALALWAVPYRQLGLPLHAAALYPLTVLAMEGVALRSLVLSFTGGLAWKGRTLGRPRIRLW